MKVEYKKTTPRIDFSKLSNEAVLPKDMPDAIRGDAKEALRNAQYKVEEVYEGFPKGMRSICLAKIR